MRGYINDIEKAAFVNDNFRKVLYTSKGYMAYVIFDVNGRTPNKAK